MAGGYSPAFGCNQKGNELTQPAVQLQRLYNGGGNRRGTFVLACVARLFDSNESNELAFKRNSKKALA